MAQKVSMNQEPKYDDSKPLQVKRGRVDSVSLYEVKENELDIIEHGEPTAIYLNFSIFLLSIAFSCIVSLSTATFSNEILKYTFLFVSILGIIGGVLLLIIWRQGRKSIKSVVQNIRDRIPPDTTMNFSHEKKPESEDENIEPKE